MKASFIATSMQEMSHFMPVGVMLQVIFAIMHEPHDQNDAVLVRVTHAAIRAIRAAGAGQLILVNGNDWGSEGWRPGAARRRC